MNNLQIISSLKENMPKSIATIGYGSGVFKQVGYDKDEKPDKDVILIVDDFKQFLIDDYEMNPQHFSKDFNKKALYKKREKSNFYSNVGCLKLYNDNIHFKVMIISKAALEYDLATWKYFGMAGRLTKPILYQNIPEELENAIKQNRQSILITALLLNEEETLSKIDLYNTISKITYMYDFRTNFHAEKKTKSNDIVGGALNFFEKEYGQNPILNQMDDEHVYNSHPIELISTLPTNLKNTIYSKLNKKDEEITEEDLTKIKKIIENYFKKTNFPNSIRLALASGSILGFKGSAKHVLQKFKKSMKK